MNYNAANLGYLAIWAAGACESVDTSVCAAPAVGLRLTCVPAPCVKCVWPKSLPVAACLSCRAGSRCMAPGPLPVLAICQRPCSAPCEESRKKKQKKQQTLVERCGARAHIACGLTLVRADISRTLLAPLAHQHAAAVESNATGEDAVERGALIV